MSNSSPISNPLPIYDTAGCRLLQPQAHHYQFINEKRRNLGLPPLQAPAGHHPCPVEFGLDLGPAVDLGQLTSRHAHVYDKHFRMWAGAASTLVAYRHGQLELNVEIDSRLDFPLAQITFNIAEPWTWEPELKKAGTYLIHLYYSDANAGLSISSGPDVKARLLAAIKDFSKQHASQPVKIHLGTISGTFIRKGGFLRAEPDINPPQEAAARRWWEELQGLAKFDLTVSGGESVS